MPPQPEAIQAGIPRPASCGISWLQVRRAASAMALSVGREESKAFELSGLQRFTPGLVDALRDIGMLRSEWGGKGRPRLSRPKVFPGGTGSGFGLSFMADRHGLTV